MITAYGYGIEKVALNALAKRVAAGLYNPDQVASFRQRGILRDKQTYSEGLIRGNKVLLQKYFPEYEYDDLMTGDKVFMGVYNQNKKPYIPTPSELVDDPARKAMAEKAIKSKVLRNVIARHEFYELGQMTKGRNGGEFGHAAPSVVLNEGRMVQFLDPKYVEEIREWRSRKRPFTINGNQYNNEREWLTELTIGKPIIKKYPTNLAHYWDD